jgi:hypothetical protein
MTYAEDLFYYFLKSSELENNRTRQHEYVGRLDDYIRFDKQA